MSERIKVPKWATGLRLCKMVGDKLVMAEPVQFASGQGAVDTALRRAAISGKVGPIGETGEFWADILNKDGDWEDTVALDRRSWGSLKNHWMRCKIDPTPTQQRTE